MNAWDTAAVWLVAAMVIPATGFPVLYFTFYRWWRNPIGRALMTKAVGLALLIDLAVVHLLVGTDYPGAEALRLLTYAVICLGLWYQFVVFIKIRLQERKSHAHLQDPEL